MPVGARVIVPGLTGLVPGAGNARGIVAPFDVDELKLFPYGTAVRPRYFVRLDDGRSVYVTHVRKERQ